MCLDDRASEIIEHALRIQIVNSFQALGKLLGQQMWSAAQAVEDALRVPKEEEVGAESTENKYEKEVAGPPKKPVPTAPLKSQ